MVVAGGGISSRMHSLDLLFLFAHDERMGIGVSDDFIFCVKCAVFQRVCGPKHATGLFLNVCRYYLNHGRSRLRLPTTHLNG